MDLARITDLHFDRLRLNGFKSFVDPTDLVIRDGLTGVVGPNGCGKSNLLEALRWVMGENRPTAMRGGGMEDVIFAGTTSRTARAHAEVTLTIDNSQRLAPVGMNDADQLEITRRITRDAGSAYRINGKDVRARDVQMLFADASTGAHSPALVRQGQISELINAKPKARRRILEEAAGISGLYQRRHEAGLKLNAAEANLTRVDDTLDQLAKQAASLARQARTARRYREIGQELRLTERQALWSRWAEAEAQRKAAASALQEAMAAATRAEAAARRAEAERSQAEAAMPPLREEEQIAAAILSRATVGREALDNAAKDARKTIETLSSRLAQLDKDITREATLNRDAADMVARLEDEAAGLEKSHAGHDAALAAAEAAEAEAAESLHRAEAALAELQDESARLAAQAQSAERLVADLRRMHERAAAAGAGAEAETSAALAASQVQETSAALSAAEANQTAAEAAIQTAEDQLTRAEAARLTAEGAETAARTARAEAEGEAGALVAECDALARLVARNAGQDGQLIDQIAVSPGYEAAFGAAFGDDLNLPALDGSDQGRPGWQDLPPVSAPLSLPEGTEPLAPEVTAPPLLSRRLAQIGIVSDAETGAALQKNLQHGQRLVSKAGDLWRWDGLTIPAGEGISQAALHLQQVNRLKRLRTEAEAATTRAAAAIAAHEAAETTLREAAAGETAARQTRREAEQTLSHLSRDLSQAETALAAAEAKTTRIKAELTRHREDETDAANRLAEAEKALAALPDRAAAIAAVEQARTGVEAARIATLSRRAALDEIAREGTACLRRMQQITQELSGWKTRLDQADSRAKELAARHEASTRELAEAEARPAGIAAELARLTEAEAEAETRLAAARAAALAAETRTRDAALAEREAERMASTARETRAAAEARAEAAMSAEADARQHIADEAGTNPDRLRTELGDGDPPPLATLEAEIMRLRSARDALGAVNLRADEDQQALEEERATLDRERSDLTEAIGKLRGGIANLNREGRERLLAAFDTVNGNFATLFSHLFGGGEARLIMVESDDPLDAGLEILCQPPGKRLAALSLLSGGEQTLTALALIFAVFLANPAPICVLDEVDAPLDDANVTRFCDMLDQMTTRTQTRFLVITHHSVTMARMDRLFGVTMVEQGVSQLVSVNLKAAESLVA